MENWLSPRYIHQENVPQEIKNDKKRMNTIKKTIEYVFDWSFVLRNQFRFKFQMPN